MLTSRCLEPRRGFALLAAIMVVAIMAILAAVIAPSTVRMLNDVRVAKAETSLERLAAAIVRFKLGIGVYPGRLNHLAVQITTADKNSCGNNYTQGQINAWAGGAIDTVGGAYIARPVPPGGLPLAGGLGYVRDSLSRKPAGFFDLMELAIPGGTEDDAILLNDKMDGIDDYVASDATNGNQTGTIRWTPPDANRFVDLTYVIPLFGC